jgi:AsmA protein
VVVVVAAVAIFAMTFDPNRYKDDIQRIVKERTGRTLELKGPLELAFWPSLGAKVSGVVFSERGAPQPFVSLDLAHASVAVLPLLRGNVTVDRVRLSGLKAQIIKDKEGRFNFQDLIESPAEKPAAKSEKKKDSGGAAVAFDIAGVTIERAAVTYRDLNTGQEIALGDLKLETGRISENAQGKVEFATSLKRNTPPLDAKLALNGNYSLKPEAVALDFNAKLDESTIKGRAAMARAKVASYDFDLNIDKLNLDRYLAASEKKSGKEEPAKPAPKDKESDAPVDLSGLKGLNAKGKVEIGALQVQGLKLAALKTEIRAADGRAEIGPHSANLYEGSLAGTLALDGNANRVALKETLSNIAIGPLLRDFAQQDRLEGRGNLALDVNAAGKTVNTMKSALNGAAKVNLRDGAVKGVDIGAIINKARSAIGSQPAQAAADGSKERTDFSELNATFVIKNGVAHNEDLDVKAPLFRVAGAGSIDIPRSSINYVVKATVVATAKGQGGKERDDLAGLTVPVKLTGPLDAMKYEVDYRAVAGALAKSKVGGQAKEAIDKNREKVEDKVKDRLKGLLGR